jgi:hypothetical protein
MSEEKFSGVDTVIQRMQTHPEEFFSSGGKQRWDFMYKDYFRDAMTESEKGRVHEALRTVRRYEFDALVVKELMKDEMGVQEEDDTEDTVKYKAAGRYQMAPLKTPGGRV